MTATAPTGVSDARVASALDAIRTEIGAEHVLIGDLAGESRDRCWRRVGRDYRPAGVRRPGSVEPRLHRKRRPSA